MITLQFDFQVSNDGARAALREVDQFLAHASEKMVDQKRDRADTATLSYVILRSFRDKLAAEVTRQKREWAQADLDRKASSRPTVRERRGR